MLSGDTIEGRSPASLSEIIETGGKVASGLVGLVQEAKDLVYEVRTEYALKETIENANALILQVKQGSAGFGPDNEKYEAGVC